jgi:hypothetical protein
LKRIVVVGTALAVLVGAGVASAAYNTYGATSLTISKGVGSAKKPVALRMVEKLVATAPMGERAAPLTNIKLTIHGVKLDAGKLQTCSDAKILQNKISPTGACPKGSLIGTGGVQARLGSGSNNTVPGTPCNPYLNVFNGGPKTQVFYFWTKSANNCGGLATGSTAPYDGHISYKGGNAVINVPLPPDISTKVAGQPNLYSSLIAQTVNYAKQGYMVGVGCQKGKRAWSVAFTAHDYNGSNETQTVSGKAAC